MSGKNMMARRLLKSLALFVLSSQSQKAVADEESKPHLEVERKFRLFGDELDGLLERLPKCGFSPSGEVTMTDTFLPAIKDEDMVRIRVESESGETRRILTLKDWVIIDGERERREQEGPVGLIAGVLLRLVGRLVQGRPLLSFTKLRDLHSRTDADSQVVVSVDRVSGLGVYSGLYLEVEIIVAIGGDVKSAREKIKAEVFALLGENREFVPRSYQDMLRETTV